MSGAGAVILRSGTVTIAGTWNLTGTVTINGGTISFNSGAMVQAVGRALMVSGGTVNFNSGAMVQAVGGTLTASGGTITFSNSVMDTNPLNLTSLSISGSGMVNFSSGVAIDTGTLTESGGTLTGTDTVTVSGLTTWTGGTMSGKGTTAVAAGGTLQLGASDSNSHQEVLNARTLNNAGTATWLGTAGAVQSAERQHV